MLEINPEEALLQSAVEALRQGDTARAKEFLTRLIKDDQNNATYWVWLSAAMDTPKERLYCLQTALKLDPNNVAARRGLVMLGAMPPDDSIPPFPLNHERSWEGNLARASEEGKPRDFKGLVANPAVRLGGIIVIALALIGISVLGFSIGKPLFYSTPTRRFNPVYTYTVTVTSLPSPTPYYRTSTPTYVGATPLALLLQATYTPTPLVVNTPHPAAEAYRAGIRFFERGDFQNTVLMMEQVATIEPSAADAFYYMGLGHLGVGNAEKAQQAFEKGIEVNSYFAPNYVGLARAKLAQDATEDVQAELDKAVELDPALVEAYIERANFELNKEEPDYEKALADTQKLMELAPGSPFTYLYAAQAHLGLGQAEEALSNAQQALALDMTILDTYRVLGMAHMANEEYDKALSQFNTYLLYKPGDEKVTVLVTDINFLNGNYEEVIQYATDVLAENEKDADAYLLRGKSYLALEKYQEAYEDFKLAQALLPYVPETNLLLAESMLKIGEAGDAYTFLNKVESRMKTDEQFAQFYYWRAKSLEELGEMDSAARDWQNILDLPEEAMTPELRAEALASLFKIYTPTPQFSPTPEENTTATATPKVTATTSAKKTATPTPKVTPTK